MVGFVFNLAPSDFRPFWMQDNVGSCSSLFLHERREIMGDLFWANYAAKVLLQSRAILNNRKCDLCGDHLSDPFHSENENPTQLISLIFKFLCCPEASIQIWRDIAQTDRLSNAWQLWRDYIILRYYIKTRALKLVHNQCRYPSKMSTRLPRITPGEEGESVELVGRRV